jgi:hypothetical protein
MLALFALLGVGAVLRDRAANERRLALWVAGTESGTGSGTGTRTVTSPASRPASGTGSGTGKLEPGGPGSWGPAFWNRPWLLAAGVAFGLASSVKWSGLYFLAVFAVYALGSEVLRRRRAGIPSWLTGTLVQQGPITFLLTVPVALLVYLASWTGWFATSGGYYRQWVQDGGGTAWQGALAWVPLDFQN